MSDDLIQAYDADTGHPVRHLVPRAWIGHPILGRGYTDQPPDTGAADESVPSGTDQTPADPRRK